MEEKRKRLVWLLFCVFLAIIFEGVLRKWIFPGYHRYLFFIRDPFVIFAYVYALYAGLSPKQGTLFYLIIGFTIMITMFSFFQTLYSHLPWWIIAYSWRTHFLMLPISLMVGSFVKKQELMKLFRFSLFITPLYAAIVYLQSISPQDHWINAGRLGIFRPLSAQFGLIRTEGFFTSSVGNAIFVGMLVAILIGVWIKEEWKEIANSKERKLFLFLTTTIIVLSGQRTTFLLVGLILFAGAVVSLTGTRKMVITYFKPALSLVILASFLLALFFPVHHKAISSRFSDTGSANSIVGYDIIERTINDLTSFYKELAVKIPEMGLGIGYSSNAAYVYNISVIDIISENEWGRHIIELGPFFGFLVIIFRVFLFLYLLFLTAAIALKKQEIMPFVFFTLLSPFMLFGQLTGNGIASGFIWFLAGVVLAMINHSNQDSQINQDNGQQYIQPNAA